MSFSEDWLIAGGNLGALVRATDWSGTSLGPRERWPAPLRTALGIVVESPIPMAMVWGPEGALLYNDACREIVGDSHPRALGRPMCEVWPALAAVVARGEAQRLADQQLELDGPQGCASAAFTVGCSPIRLADGHVGGSLLTLQATTSAREALLFTMIEHAREGINLLDLITWRYVFMSPAQIGLTGFTVEEINSFSAEEAYARVHPDDRQRSVEQQRRVAAGEDPGGTPIEYRWMVKSGEYRWFSDIRTLVRDARGEPVALVGVSRDITDRTLAEEAGRDAAEKLRVAVANAAIGFAITTPDGSFTDANPAYCAITGYTLDELRNLRFAELIHPDDHAANIAQIQRMLGGETSDFTVENRYVRKGGEPVWVRKSVSLVRTSSGAPRWMIALCEDISDRHETQAALVCANDQLERANRDKTQFLALLSHELRNPLAPIMHALEILDIAPATSEQALRAKQVLRRQAKQLARLVDDLLDTTRVSRGKIQLQRCRMQLGEAVRSTAEDHRAAFEAAGIGLEIQVPPEPIYIDADPNRIAQVVGNLCNNAAKFTPRDGEVSVSVGVDLVTHEAVLRVVDSGIGIVESMLAQVFEPFMQADKTLAHSKGGLGLGLAVVKGVVELHGGSVAVHSAGLGCGSELSVRLPLAPRLA